MKIIIPIDAVPQKRTGTSKYGKRFDPAESRQFKKDLATLIQFLKRGANLFTGAVKVDIKVFRQANKFKSGVTSRQFGDADNLAKGILDACNGILWIDDAQVVDLHITKNLADTPFIILELEEF